MMRSHFTFRVHPAAILSTVVATAFALCATGCGQVWNDPYPAADRDKNILYRSFAERPKTLDPARAYASDEWNFVQQIYEPPLQYHYLKRPYELVPQAADSMPEVRYIGADGATLPANAPVASIAYTDYVIHLRRDMRYQPHPALAVDRAGRARYLNMTEAEVKQHHVLADFADTGTRPVFAADYLYQIKRLAHPRLNSPVYSHLAEYIVGLKELGDRLKVENEKVASAHSAKYGPADRALPWLDLREFELPGVELIDQHNYRIRIKGKYPQFIYWLAMPFFAPMPYEAERFHAQRGMSDGRNITLDWFPIGSGPYLLAENNPNARMTLAKNPNFPGEAYPSEGEEGDRPLGLLVDAGKKAPFIDQIVFSREKEGIPLWNKFLQGYYDESGIGSDNFDQAVNVSFEGQANLTEEMETKGIRLRTSVGTSTFYMAFNFKDDIVGGRAERAKKLRQAISIAMDWEEYISIFRNGRGSPGMSPIPPGIYGHREGEAGVNPVVYDLDRGRAVRKSIETARRLLAEAGYPDGRDAKTGAPLVLYLDTVQRGPGDRPIFDWYRRQLEKLSIQLQIRATDWNRFQEKVRSGNTQLFFMGWNADYPDPENFLFLLYGPQAVSRAGGDNKANYENPAFDTLFEQMKNMENGPEREALIDRMLEMVRDDAPWVFGFHPVDFALSHRWVGNMKPNQMARNGLKFVKLDPWVRAQQRASWNRPVQWPLAVFAAVIALVGWIGWRVYRRRERHVPMPDAAPVGRPYGVRQPVKSGRM